MAVRLIRHQNHGSHDSSADKDVFPDVGLAHEGELPEESALMQVVFELLDVLPNIDSQRG